MHIAIRFFLILPLLTGCDSDSAASPPTEQSTPSATEDATPIVDPMQWTGRWLGPEGTYLDIVHDGESLHVVISNLDGPRTFTAQVNGPRLEFERDGQVESIRAGTGEQTAMKWLVDKKSCLIVNAGEGYCRD